jgi:hypothetical protein
VSVPARNAGIQAIWQSLRYAIKSNSRRRARLLGSAPVLHKKKPRGILLRWPVRGAYGPRKGLSPLASVSSEPDFLPEQRGHRATTRKEGFYAARPRQSGTSQKRSEEIVARNTPAESRCNPGRRATRRARGYGFASWRELKAYVAALLHEGARLASAVRSGDVANLRAILDQKPELVNAASDLDRMLRPSDALTMRLIHLAVAEDRREVAQLLIERGADLNVRNADGRLPLHDCFELGRDEFAKFLLAAGAEADISAAAAYGMHHRLSDTATSRRRRAFCWNTAR